MLHPLNDARERQYGGAVPSGSLLVWIDEMYGVPKTPEDKVFGFWPTAKSARRMFGRAAQEQHALPRLQPAAGRKGTPTNPIEHGQFNEDDTCFWRPSFWGVTDTTWESGTKRCFQRSQSFAAVNGTTRRCRTKRHRPGRHRLEPD